MKRRNPYLTDLYPAFRHQAWRPQSRWNTGKPLGMPRSCGVTEIQSTEGVPIASVNKQVELYHRMHRDCLASPIQEYRAPQDHLSAAKWPDLLIPPVILKKACRYVAAPVVHYKYLTVAICRIKKNYLNHIVDTMTFVY